MDLKLATIYGFTNYDIWLDNLQPMAFTSRGCQGSSERSSKAVTRNATVLPEPVNACRRQEVWGEIYFCLLVQGLRFEAWGLGSNKSPLVEGLRFRVQG